MTGKGFKGGSELLLTDRPLPTVRGGRPELVASATDTGSKLPQSVELGRMAVGIIVHPKNMLNSLPLNELRGILCGEIRQWPGANGSADTMHVYGPHADDAVVQLLKEKIGDMSLKYHVLPDNQKVILEIARDSAAIGFVDLSQLSPDEKSVKLVDVYLPGQPNQAKTSAKDANRAKQGAEGEGQSSPQSFAHRLTSLAACGLPEDYPLVRTFPFYASPRASEAAKDFAQFVASDHCATTLIQHNLLPPLYAAPDRGTNRTRKAAKDVQTLSWKQAIKPSWTSRQLHAGSAWGRLVPGTNSAAISSFPISSLPEKWNRCQTSIWSAPEEKRLPLFFEGTPHDRGSIRIFARCVNFSPRHTTTIQRRFARERNRGDPNIVTYAVA